MASTFERITKLSISLSGSDLSNGTTTPVPQTTARYATPHS